MAFVKSVCGRLDTLGLGSCNDLQDSVSTLAREMREGVVHAKDRCHPDPLVGSGVGHDHSHDFAHVPRVLRIFLVTRALQRTARSDDHIRLHGVGHGLVRRREGVVGVGEDLPASARLDHGCSCDKCVTKVYLILTTNYFIFTQKSINSTQKITGGLRWRRDLTGSAEILRVRKVGAVFYEVVLGEACAAEVEILCNVLLDGFALVWGEYLGRPLGATDVVYAVDAHAVHGLVALVCGTVGGHDSEGGQGCCGERRV